MGVVLGLEKRCRERIRSQKTQHRNRINLDVTQLLDQTLGRRIFQDRAG